MRAPLAIDLYSGCGGLTLGLKQAGFEVIGAVEINSLAVETYKANHPNTVVWKEDIRKLAVRRVMEGLRIEKRELDLLAGCPPCQGFSTMRTLNGGRKINEPQNDLVFEFLRFVRVLKPKAVMLENVPGLAVDWRIHVFRQKLERLGYLCHDGVLNAADYGVPQRRRRMILLGGGEGHIEPAKAQSEKVTVRDAIGSLPPPGDSGDPLHDLPESRAQHVLDLIKRIPKNGGSRSDINETHRLACHRKCNGFWDVYGRMAWDDVAPTITSGCVNPSKGRFLHPEQDRAITLREAALLQSFPPGYRFSLGRGKFAAAEMIGNALPPELVRRQASQVFKYLQVAARDSKPSENVGHAEYRRNP